MTYLLIFFFLVLNYEEQAEREEAIQTLLKRLNEVTDKTTSIFAQYQEEVSIHILNLFIHSNKLLNLV